MDSLGCLWGNAVLRDQRWMPAVLPAQARGEGLIRSQVCCYKW